jgi:hypothetical protein
MNNICLLPADQLLSQWQADHVALHKKWAQVASNRNSTVVRCDLAADELLSQWQADHAALHKKWAQVASNRNSTVVRCDLANTAVTRHSSPSGSCVLQLMS